MIAYTSSLHGITPARLNGGFFAGWPNPPTPETHLRLLAGSAAVVLALDESAPGAPVIGFVNALSDGVLSAYIPLLEVLPAYQGRGIGSELMRRMLARLGGLYMIDVVCDPAVQPFYERLGLRTATGMIHRNYPAQAGLPPGEELT